MVAGTEIPRMPSAMGEAPHGADSGGPGVHVATDEVDPELLALPLPPRGRRLLSMALMLCVVGVAVGLLAHLRADVAYGFAPNRATELGAIATLDLRTLVPNTFVRIRGTPMLGLTVRYERALSGQFFAVFPLAGQRQVFVQVPLEALRDPARAGRAEWSGRLLTFGQLGGRFRGVRDYLVHSMHLPVTAESFVLLAEEQPVAHGWALALSALCLAIIGFTGVLMARWFRAL
jgi:hypothetical protein